MNFLKKLDFFNRKFKFSKKHEISKILKLLYFEIINKNLKLSKET